MKIDKKIKSVRANWTFDNKVTKSFDMHVSKSVPFYQISHNLTVSISDYFLKNNSVCYDLGSSTGTLLKKIKLRNTKKKLNI